MNNNFYQVWLSAETKQQSENMLCKLTNKRLIVGGTILNGPSHFWWKGKEIDMDYYYVVCFTIRERREELETEYKKISVEGIPMMSCIKIEGNEEFFNFVHENTKR